MYYNYNIETNESEINMAFDLKTLLIVAAVMIGILAIVGLVLYFFARELFYNIITFFVVDNGKVGEHEKLLDPVPRRQTPHNRKGWH